MKIREILFILFLIIMNNYVSAQSINDTIFKNVILIQKEDVVKNNDNYLIDVVLDNSKTPVVFNNSKLSKQFFDKRMFKNKPYILVIPDTKYYKSIHQTVDKGENCCDMPLNINIYYQRIYENNIFKIDSLKITGNQPKIVFTQSISALKLNDNIIFYHTESFGSTCCPKDPKWKIIEKLDGYINSFEKTNNIKLGDIYKKITGKEGEHTLYFTLSNLSKEQKLNFLQAVRYWHFENKDIPFAPLIFSPNSIKKEGLTLVTE